MAELLLCTELEITKHGTISCEKFEDSSKQYDSCNSGGQLLTNHSLTHPL
jgi:hypothetical protein